VVDTNYIDTKFSALEDMLKDFVLCLALPNYPPR